VAAICAARTSLVRRRPIRRGRQSACSLAKPSQAARPWPPGSESAVLELARQQPQESAAAIGGGMQRRDPTGVYFGVVVQFHLKRRR
jgi:hypothetical protein